VSFDRFRIGGQIAFWLVETLLPSQLALIQLPSGAGRHELQPVRPHDREAEVEENLYLRIAYEIQLRQQLESRD
jgi:hypothetical protein